MKWRLPGEGLTQRPSMSLDVKFQWSRDGAALSDHSIRGCKEKERNRYIYIERERERELI
jgi:hypothetical protein